VLYNLKKHVIISVNKFWGKESKMHYNRLLKAKSIARKVFKKYHGTYPEFLSEKERKRFRNVNKVLGSFRKTKVFCSSPFCCGNPRRIGKLTIQERRAFENNYSDEY